jgi:hypothetical protein
MEIVSLRHTLGAKWAGSPLLALLFFVPTSIIVAIQERNTPFVEWWWSVAAEAVVQHLAIAVVITVLIALSRRRWPILPSELTIFIWALGGASRGLVGGWFVAEFAGVAPEYGYRIAYWILVTLVWNTLVTYMVAQFDLQRSLLVEVGSLESDRETERGTATKTEAELKSEVLTVLRDGVSPVIVEIRKSVAAASRQHADNFESIGRHIEAVTHQIDTVMSSATLGSTTAIRQKATLTPLGAALRFGVSRPVYSSMLVTLATATILIPEELRVDGFAHSLVAAAALASGAATLTVLHALGRLRSQPRPWAARLIRLSASLVSGSVYLIGTYYSLTAADVAWIILMPLSFYFASMSLSSAVGLAESNLTLLEERDLLQAEVNALRESNRDITDQVRSNLRSLMHGPILGRLSACVMALNFHEGSAPNDETKTAELVSRISAHLELVIEDLEVLTMPRTK